MHEFEIIDITSCEPKTREHTSDGPFLGRSLAEYTQDNHREKTTRSKPEGKSNDLGHKTWRMDTKITSQNDSATSCQPSQAQFRLFRHVWLEHGFTQIVGNR